jgi:uncharacterized oxidoreductase
MPRFKPDHLQQIGIQLFTASGCNQEDARTVADHLVESSLFGHDSHGTLRFYEYVQQIRDGIFNPQGRPYIIQERACTATVDGNGALGQVGAAYATQLVIQKAKEHGVASVGLRNTSHVGRIGAYPLAMARQGIIGLAFVNAGRLGRQITPYGGLDGKLSTNPIAFAAPRENNNPIMVDMTTSVTAEGKIRVAENRGVHVPEGWIIDHDGRPATDPIAFTGDPPGAILPLGGVVAYKGYCLSFIVEIMGGTLGGQGCAAGETVMQSNGVLLTAYNIEHFTDLETYYQELEGLIGHVHTSRIDPNVGSIQLPGEPEFSTCIQRQEQGIALDDTTWQRICEAARVVDLDPSSWDSFIIAD